MRTMGAHLVRIKNKKGTVTEVFIKGNGERGTSLASGIKKWFAGSHFEVLLRKNKTLSANPRCEPGSHPKYKTNSLISVLKSILKSDMIS